MVVNPASLNASLLINTNPSSFIRLDSVNNSHSVSHNEDPVQTITINVSSPDRDMIILKNEASLGNVEKVKDLCSKKKIIEKLAEYQTKKIGDTPLFEAAKWDQFKTVRVILEAAKDYSKELLIHLINSRNYQMEKQTPILYAASRHHMDTCQAMIDQVAPLRLDPYQYLTEIPLPGREGTERALSQGLGVVFETQLSGETDGKKLLNAVMDFATC